MSHAERKLERLLTPPKCPACDGTGEGHPENPPQNMRAEDWRVKFEGSEEQAMEAAVAAEFAPPGRLAPAALPQIEDTKDDQARVDRECEVVGQDLPRTDNQLASTLGLRRAQPRPFIPDPEDQELYDKLAAAEAEVLRLTTRVQELEAELLDQWESNHTEHCRRTWPHDGVCHWPPPESIQELARLRVVRETPEGENNGCK